MDLSVVIPCFNEADGIPQLREKLSPVINEMKKQYQLELIFVDDGSTDNTFELLKNNFTEPEYRIVRHDKNQNLGAATRTGFANANGRWVAFLDSDCTYEPSLLKPMIEEMKNGADLVTLSPYHPKGKVEGVAPYRLFLSKGLSFIYRIVLGKEIFTYTAMVRIYQKSIVERIVSPRNDFSSIAEMMLKSLKQNLVVKEVPAVLSVRRFGESKMKTLKVIKAHLGLLAKLIFSPSSYKK